MSVVSMADMAPGEQGTIYQMPNDNEARNRLEQMGLRCGVAVGIRNRMPMRGPLLVCAGRTEVAIGNDLAADIKVLVAGQCGHGSMRKRHRWFR